MCEFKDITSYHDLTPAQQGEFDAHARGEGGKECQHCRAKYFDPAFYQATEPARRVSGQP